MWSLIAALATHLLMLTRSSNPVVVQPYAREVYAKVAKLVEEDKFELPEVTTFTPENMHEAFAFTIKSHSGAGGKAVIDMSNGVP